MLEKYFSAPKTLRRLRIDWKKRRLLCYLASNPQLHPSFHLKENALT